MKKLLAATGFVALLAGIFLYGMSQPAKSFNEQVGANWWIDTPAGWMTMFAILLTVAMVPVVYQNRRWITPNMAVVGLGSFLLLFLGGYLFLGALTRPTYVPKTTSKPAPGPGKVELVVYSGETVLPFRAAVKTSAGLQEFTGATSARPGTNSGMWRKTITATGLVAWSVQKTTKTGMLRACIEVDEHPVADGSTVDPLGTVTVTAAVP